MTKKKRHKMVTKAVAFNILDPDQETLLEHALKRKNFSSYMKRLIQRDIDNNFKPKVIQQQQTEKKSSEPKLNEDFMNNLI